MKFTIDTTTKTIEVYSASISEIETIKKGVEAMGLNPTEFMIVSGMQYYPQFYPQHQPYISPSPYCTSPSIFETTCSNGAANN